MTREELALAACEGVPDDMLRNVRLLALLDKSQALLSSSDALKADAAECMRMLEVVTRELLACVEQRNADAKVINGLRGTLQIIADDNDSTGHLLRSAARAALEGRF